MQEREILKLWALPGDVEAREKRIEQLEGLLGVRREKGVSGGKNGRACLGQRAPANPKLPGKALQDPPPELSAQTRQELSELCRQLIQKNQECQREYVRWVERIESAPGADLRRALHLVCLEGWGWEETAAQLGRGTGDSWRKRVYRFLRTYDQGEPCTFEARAGASSLKEGPQTGGEKGEGKNRGPALAGPRKEAKLFLF